MDDDSTASPAFYVPARERDGRRGCGQPRDLRVAAVLITATASRRPPGREGRGDL